MARTLMQDIIPPNPNPVAGSVAESILASLRLANTPSEILGFTDPAAPEPPQPSQPDILSGMPSGPNNLATRGSMTLTPQALASFIQAARMYGGVKGLHELSMFGPLSTYRTFAEQARLGGTSQNPGGTNPNATTAGSSYHERGLAVDLPAALKNAVFYRILNSLGWNQLSGEPWHWTYRAYG